MSRVPASECLDIDLETEQWVCNRCDHQIGSARENFKFGCLVYERNPDEIYAPVFPTESEFTLTTKEGYGVFLEFYCPSCGTMIENECLPPGYPPTWDVQLDIDALRARFGSGRGDSK